MTYMAGDVMLEYTDCEIWQVMSGYSILTAGDVRLPYTDDIYIWQVTFTHLGGNILREQF